MGKVCKIGILILAAALLLAGCSMPTVDELYCLPKRADVDSDLQEVIDEAMAGLQYSAPISGENQQTVQTADLDGDGIDEYILFAKDSTEKPLKILIFSQLAAGYALMDTIEGYGFAFEFVDYANVDDRPGLEIIVGRQVSDQMVRAVSVYRFTSGFSRQLMTASYIKLLTGDMDRDGLENLLLLSPGQDDDSNATAVLFGFRNGQMQRSAEIELSAPVDDLKRVSLGMLADRTPAIYTTAVRDDQTLLSDVLIADDGQIRSVLQGLETTALDNYYIYPEDIDGDGIMELPALWPIPQENENNQYLIRWFTLAADGVQTDKIYTYHNCNEGWYLRFPSHWADRIRIEQEEDVYRFFLFHEEDNEYRELFSVLVLSGPDREERAAQEGYILLYSGDTEVYVATLGEYGLARPITEDELKACFRLIRMDWNSDENWGDNHEESIDP